MKQVEVGTMTMTGTIAQHIDIRTKVVFASCGGKAALLLLMLLLFAQTVRGTSGGTVMDSTQYESIHTTAFERTVLIGVNALLVPLALGAAAVSIVPPSAGIVAVDGMTYAALGFETGVGLGRLKKTGRFADARLMVGYTHVYNRHQPEIWRAEAVADVHGFFIDKRELFLLGGSPSAGVFVRGAESGYTLGSSVRLMVPSLPYFGLFPLHTIGVTYRYHKYFSGGMFHTISLGVSAAVIF